MLDFRDVDGWLSEHDASLLSRSVTEALGAVPGGAIVEIGSYKGRSTIVLATAARPFEAPVYAIDPHAGDVSLGERVQRLRPTFGEFLANLDAAGVRDLVVPLIERAQDVVWPPARPIALLFIDGLHDYDSVRRDFEQFESSIASAARVAFHDYAPGWGVVPFVDELLAGDWRELAAAGSTIVIARRAPTEEVASLG